MDSIASRSLCEMTLLVKCRFFFNKGTLIARGQDHLRGIVENQKQKLNQKNPLPPTCWSLRREYYKSSWINSWNVTPAPDGQHLKGLSARALSKTRYKIWKYVSFHFNTTPIARRIQFSLERSDRFRVHLESGSRQKWSAGGEAERVSGGDERRLDTLHLWERWHGGGGADIRTTMHHRDNKLQ